MEQSFLAYLRGRCRSLPQVAVGIGDDAAVILPAAAPLVVCTDQIIDGVDFRSGEHSLGDVGFKSMAINLSDIAAMGATATAALVTLSLPKQGATRIAGEVYEGILEAASAFGIAIAGGDISTYSGPLAISVTLVGHVPQDQAAPSQAAPSQAAPSQAAPSQAAPSQPAPSQPAPSQPAPSQPAPSQAAEGGAWLRSGAREGDAIVVSGAVGGSILGRHLRPQPRVELAAQLRELVDIHAAIDISDGLSLDLDRLCAASGVGAELDVASIPIHPDAVRLSESTGRTPLDHAWSDGEDYELILAMSEKDADRVCASDLGVPLTRIGNFVGRTGLWKRMSGKMQRLSPQGYLH